MLKAKTYSLNVSRRLAMPVSSAAKKLTLACWLVLLAACAGPAASPQQIAPETAQAAVPVAPTGLSAAQTPTTAAAGPSPTFELKPFPYTTPVPPEIPTEIDGSYTKFDPSPGTPVPCRRCPDYLLEGGEWGLTLERGIFRIRFSATGWRSLGSYTISDNRITLFNDPVCHQEIGIYTWSLEGDQLSFELVDDPCAIGLRAKNLTDRPWTIQSR